jgi:hypothetical protein
MLLASLLAVVAGVPECHVRLVPAGILLAVIVPKSAVVAGQGFVRVVALRLGGAVPPLHGAVVQSAIVISLVYFVLSVAQSEFGSAEILAFITNVESDTPELAWNVKVDVPVGIAIPDISKFSVPA